MKVTEIVKDRMLGCLYSQALGDAFDLGSDFMDKDEVCKTYTNGLCKYEIWFIRIKIFQYLI